MHKQIMHFVVAAFVLCAISPTYAQDDGDSNDDVDDGSVSCITLRNVRRTDAIDDRNVLYYMRGGPVYHNILPHACNGLARENRFSYTTNMGRLCSHDLISVIFTGPFGLQEGTSCQLGDFHKITKEDAKALKDAPTPAPTSNPLPMPDPQEVGAGEEVPETL